MWWVDTNDYIIYLFSLRKSRYNKLVAHSCGQLISGVIFAVNFTMYLFNQLSPRRINENPLYPLGSDFDRVTLKSEIGCAALHTEKPTAKNDQPV